MADVSGSSSSSTRPRRSNFDVGPIEYVQMSGVQAAGAGAGAALQQIQQVIKRWGTEGQQIDARQIRSMIDQRERDRIARSTQKNIDYLRRKMQEERAAKYGFGQQQQQQAVDDDPLYPTYGPGGSKKKGGGGGGGMKRGRAGIGAMSMGKSNFSAATPSVDTSVYVSGLPANATWDQLDMLFSAHGNIKRIKIYRDANGHPKGDALITYVKAGSIQAAVSKLHKHQLAPRVTINVSQADFSYKDENVHDGLGFDQAVHPGQEEDEQADYEQLPPECEADKYPVVILRNVYKQEDAEGDPDFFIELETDMLQECVTFGTVRRIVTPEGPYYEGSVAVVFAAFESAQNCAKAMHGRFFDGQQIEVEMQGKIEEELVASRILPVSHPAAGLVSRDYIEEGEEYVDLHAQALAEAEAEAARAKIGPKEKEGGGDEEVVEDVDAFLKSLE